MSDRPERRMSAWDEVLMEGRNEPSSDKPGTPLPGWWCDWCHTVNPMPRVLCVCGRGKLLISK